VQSSALIASGEIREWSIEPSTRCALACPRCPRTMMKGAYAVTDLPIAVVRRIFPDGTPARKIVLSGDHGDPIYHPRLHQILRYLRGLRPAPPRLSIHTNGSFRKRGWWAETASILSRQDRIVWSVDGLEDTNHIYRVNARWSSIMEGVAECRGKVGMVWKFIVFKHNEHQVEEAKRLAESLGFDDFELVKSNRFGGRWRVNGTDPMQPTIPFESLLRKVKDA
jgi:MoaA/NifB/PqqE/SkfB family radical SAM enzyme